MIDLKVIQDSVTGEYDIAVSPSGDLEGVNDLSTAVLVSLLTDRRANGDQVALAPLRRGWIGDVEPIIPGYRIGSHLWLIEPGRATRKTVNEAVTACQEALQSMIDQGIADNIEVSGELGSPRQATIRIDVTAPSGAVSTEFLELWENTAFVPTELPARFVEEQPFTPASIPGLIVWGDADFSAHVVDTECGVEVTRDLASNFDYFQSNSARRPLRIRPSTGWIYRFDGVDDFLATNNNAFPSLREGTAFFVYKPTVDQNVDGRFFALGTNGFEASVQGLAFIQAAADNIRTLGANGTLDVSVIGPSSGDAPVGVVVRWGPDTSGADIETSVGQVAVDASYSTNTPTINQAVIGAGFDDGPDITSAAGFENNVFTIYSRRISNVEVLDLLEYAGTRTFASPTGDHYTDCFFDTDDFGWID